MKHCLVWSQHALSYWLGKAENEQLMRIYGISFPENKLLAEWIKFREEAAKRDHRLIGRVSALRLGVVPVMSVS